MILPFKSALGLLSVLIAAAPALAADEEEVSFDDIEAESKKQDARVKAAPQGADAAAADAGTAAAAAVAAVAAVADAGTPAAAAPGPVKEEEVALDALDTEVVTPEYDRRGWLWVFPLLALVVVGWNVDWREQRVKKELAARRARRAPRRAG